jgi:hypothetical protein
MYKSRGSDKISVELIQAGGEKSRSGNRELIRSIWNKEQLPDQRKEDSLLNQFTKRAIKADCSIYRGISN